MLGNAFFRNTALMIIALATNAAPGWAQGPMSPLTPDSGLANQSALITPYSTTVPWVSSIPANPGVTIPRTNSSVGDGVGPNAIGRNTSGATLSGSQNQMGMQGGTQMGTQSGSTTSPSN